MITVKTQRCGHHNGPVQAAAIQIQNKFRSWKGRKEFLAIRQQIVETGTCFVYVDDHLICIFCFYFCSSTAILWFKQAHVRGHQVRNNYKKFVWTVGSVEKVILRWRRKRSGLRGFKPESLTACPNSDGASSTVDEYDYLKEGKKQTEERLEKSLGTVKSMVQYPEARAQYCRLLAAVTEIKETKKGGEKALKDSEDAVDMDADLLDIGERRLDVTILV